MRCPMRIRYYLSCLMIVALYSSASHASLTPKFISSTHAHKNLIAFNSPAKHSNYIKLASVKFIVKSSFRKPDAQASTAGCTPTAYPYTTAAVLTNCAGIDTCYDGAIVRAKCSSCKSPMGSPVNGRCSCNKETYKYGVYAEFCPYMFNESTKCQEIHYDGTLRTYYSKCACPSNFHECNINNNEVGTGLTCENEGKTLFTGCECNHSIDKTCEDYDGGSGGHCEMSGHIYYSACLEPCQSNQFREGSRDKFWCDTNGNYIEGWTAIPSFSGGSGWAGNEFGIRLRDKLY